MVQQLSPLEAAGVLLGVLYLVLAIRESLWCWPAAFLSSVLTIVVMFGARLYSEAALNVFYAAMAIYGWYQWRYGGRGQGAPELPIGVWPLRTHALAIGGSIGLAAVLGWFMSRHTGGCVPVSRCVRDRVVRRHDLHGRAQDSRELALLARCRQLESCTSTGSASSICTSGLFALYLVLVVLGLVRWHRDWRAQPVSA